LEIATLLLPPGFLTSVMALDLRKWEEVLRIGDERWGKMAAGFKESWLFFLFLFWRPIRLLIYFL